MSSAKTLNEVFSSLTARRRYEVWFVRLGSMDGSGAWWFRYLLMNPGLPRRNETLQQPVQVWATWFPSGGVPHTIVQGFPAESLDLSRARQHPFHFRILNNEINENGCRGSLCLNGHAISWQLQYRSTFRTTLSDKGWIGFSCTPHSNATFSGQITLDGRTIEGDPLGFGLQGHNSGYKHRGFWVWAHAYFPRPNGAASTAEALVYDMPLGLLFRKAVLWHNGRAQIFRSLQETVRDWDKLQWRFRASSRDGWNMEFYADARGLNIHHLDYQKTDGSGIFQVHNNSLVQAGIRLCGPGGSCEELETTAGAVLEMGGKVRPIVAQS